MALAIAISRVSPAPMFPVGVTAEVPYRRAALRPNRPARAFGSIPSVRSVSSSTTPGYLASLWGKSDAQMNVSAPANACSIGAVCSPGSNETTHCRLKYSLGLSDSSGTAHE